METSGVREDMSYIIRLQRMKDNIGMHSQMVERCVVGPLVHA